MEKIKVVLFSVFFILLASSLFFFSLRESLLPDEGTHLLLSVFYRDLVFHMLKTKSLSFSEAWNYGLWYLAHYPKLQIGYTPLFHFITGFFFIFSLNELIPRVFNILVFLLSGFILYLLGSYFYSRKVGLLSAFFFFSFLPAYRYASKVMTDTLMYFFVLLTIWIYIVAEKNDKKSLYFLSGLFSSFAFLTKQTGGISLAVITFWFLARNIKNKEKLSRIIFVFLGFSLFTIPYLFIMLKIGGIEINRYLSISYGYYENRPTSILDPFLWLWFIVNTTKRFFLFSIFVILLFVFMYRERKDEKYFRLLSWFLISYVLLSLILNKHVRYSPLFFMPLSIMSAKVLEKRETVSILFSFILLISSIWITYNEMFTYDTSSVVKLFENKEGNIGYFGEGSNNNLPFSSTIMWLDRKNRMKHYHFRVCNFIGKDNLDVLRNNSIRYIIHYPDFKIDEEIKNRLKKIKTFDNNLTVYEFIDYKKDEKICNKICLTNWVVCVENNKTWLIK